MTTGASTPPLDEAETGGLRSPLRILAVLLLLRAGVRTLLEVGASASSSIEAAEPWGIASELASGAAMVAFVVVLARSALARRPGAIHALAAMVVALAAFAFLATAPGLPRSWSWVVPVLRVARPVEPAAESIAFLLTVLGDAVTRGRRGSVATLVLLAVVGAGLGWRLGSGALFARQLIEDSLFAGARATGLVFLLWRGAGPLALPPDRAVARAWTGPAALLATGLVPLVPWIVDSPASLGLAATAACLLWGATARRGAGARWSGAIAPLIACAAVIGLCAWTWRFGLWDTMFHPHELTLAPGSRTLPRVGIDALCAFALASGALHVPRGVWVILAAEVLLLAAFDGPYLAPIVALSALAGAWAARETSTHAAQ